MANSGPFLRCTKNFKTRCATIWSENSKSFWYVKQHSTPYDILTLVYFGTPFSTWQTFLHNHRLWQILGSLYLATSRCGKPGLSKPLHNNFDKIDLVTCDTIVTIANVVFGDLCAVCNLQVDLYMYLVSWCIWYHGLWKTCCPCLSLYAIGYIISVFFACTILCGGPYHIMGLLDISVTTVRLLYGRCLAPEQCAC